jgi:hypothetical protein
VNYRPSENIEGKKGLLLSIIMVIVLNVIVVGLGKLRNSNTIEPEI